MKRLLTLTLILLFGFDAISQVERTVIVEHFTNTRCGVCASKNPAFYSLLENYPQVLHIAYHPSSPYSSCIFSQHNPEENDARTNFYGIYGGTPRAVIQGEVVPVQTPMVSSGDIESMLGENSDFMLHVSQEQTGENEVDTRVVVKRASGSSADTYLVYAMIAEKEIDYAAPNGENLHHDVFRKVLLEESFAISNSGDSVVFEESYEIHPDWVAEEMFIAVMIQDENDQTILQAAASPTLEAGASRVNEQELISAEGMFYPNPAEDYITLKAPVGVEFSKAEFYAVTGNLVKSFDKPERMNISNLPEGIYMLVLTDTKDQDYLAKVIRK